MKLKEVLIKSENMNYHNFIYKTDPQHLPNQNPSRSAALDFYKLLKQLISSKSLRF
jgi:hypothetical protein